MDLRRRLHAALALLLVPTLVVSLPAGAVVLVAWAIVGVASRLAPAAAAMTVAALVAAVVGVVHAPSVVFAVAAVASAATLGWVWRRMGATVDASAAAWVGVGAAATAVAIAGASLAQALASGFAQTQVASTHPNLTGAMALALGAASALAVRRFGWLGWALATLGVAASLGTVLLTGSRGTGVGVVLGALALVVIGLAWVLARRRPLAATVVAFGGPLLLLVAFQAIAFSPQRADAWWPRTVATVGDAMGVDESTPIGRRFLDLREPMGQTGGRLVNWRVTRELIAVRPFLGFGLDAVHSVYRNEALFRTSTPLAHPHHGPLTLALQGGALLLVAVAALVLTVGWSLAGAAVRGDGVAAVVLAFGVGVVGADLLDVVMVQGVVAGTLAVAALGALARDGEKHPRVEGGRES